MKLLLACSILGLMLPVLALAADWELTPAEIITWGYKPSIAADANGNLHLLVMDGGLKYLYKPVGRTWNEAHLNAEHVPGSEIVSAEWSRPNIDADEDGNVFVAWAMADSLFFNRRVQGVWEEARILETKWGSGWTTVADSVPIWDKTYGLLHVLYARAMAGGWSIWHKMSYDRGTYWTAEDVVCWDGITPTGEVDAYGNLHVGFHQGCGKAYNVWSPSTGWVYGYDGQGIDETNCIDEATLTASPDGVPHSIWTPFDCAGDDCFYMQPFYSRKINGMWTSLVPVSNYDHYYAEHDFPYISKVCAFSENEAIALFAVGYNQTLFFSYMNNGNWVIDQFLAQSDSGHFAVTRSGSEAIVVYRYAGSIFERRIKVSSPDEWQMAAYVTTNKGMYVPGDRFQLNTTVYSNESDCKVLDVYVVLEMMGSYFFWPSWRQNNLDNDMRQVCAPMWSENILDFTWPTGAGTYSDAIVHLAACQSGSFDLVGGGYGYSSCSFDFGVPTPTPTKTPTQVPTNTPTQVPTETPVPPSPTPTPNATLGAGR